LNRPPRPRLSKERAYLFNGAATPPNSGGDFIIDPAYKCRED